MKIAPTLALLAASPRPTGDLTAAELSAALDAGYVVDHGYHVELTLDGWRAVASLPRLGPYSGYQCYCIGRERTGGRTIGRMSRRAWMDRLDAQVARVEGLCRTP